MPDDKRFFSGGLDTAIKLWDVETGTCLYQIKREVNPISFLECSHDGKMFFDYSGDGYIKLWNITTGICQKIIECNSDICKMKSLQDEKIAFYYSGDSRIYIWDYCESKISHISCDHQEQIKELQFLSDGKHAVTFSIDNELKVWDLLNGECITKFRFIDAKRMIFFLDDNCIKAFIVNEICQIWNIDNCHCEAFISISNGEAISEVIILPNGRYCLFTFNTHKMELWDIKLNKLEHTYHINTAENEYSKKAKDLKRSPATYTQLLFEDTVNSDKCQDQSEEEVPKELPCNPEERPFIVTSDGNELRIWDRKTGKNVRSLGRQSSLINCISYMPGGMQCISGSGDGIIKLWDIGTGECIRTFAYVSGINIAGCKFSGVKFMPDELKAKIYVNGGIVDNDKIARKLNHSLKNILKNMLEYFLKKGY